MLLGHNQVMLQVLVLFLADSVGTFLIKNKTTMPLAMVAEWVYEPLQIRVADSHGSKVQIPLGICNYYV